MKFKIRHFFVLLALAAVCAQLFSCWDGQNPKTDMPLVKKDSLSIFSDSSITVGNIEPRSISGVAPNFSPNKFDYRIYKRIKNAEYTTRTRWQIELKIPNAKDSIFAAISRFSPQYKDWHFYIFVRSSIPNEWHIVGEPSGMRLMSLFLEKYFIETKGYLTLNGRDIEVELFHESANFNDLRIDSLIEYTGMCREYAYITNYPGVTDGCIEYHMLKTDSCLIPFKKIESW